MSTLQRRLSGVTDTIAHLNAQIRRMGNNDLPWVISYLTGLTGLIWLAHMAGTHPPLLPAAQPLVPRARRPPNPPALTGRAPRRGARAPPPTGALRRAP